MVSVRNPLAGFGITILGTAALSFLVGIPIVFLPRDLAYFYFPFVLFAVGVFSGRTTFIGSLGFMGALIGGIVGVYAFQALFLPAGWPLTAGIPPWLTGTSFITVLLFGAASGLGGAASGKLGQADRASHGPCPEDAPMSQVRREGRHVGPQVLVLPVVSPAHVGGRIRFSSSDRGSARR